MQISAAVLRGHRQKLAIETLQLAACRDDEVLVEIWAVGICHTDIVMRDGFFPIPPLPAVLGHEGAGIVREIGRSVQAVAPGDHVVLSFASCGHCAACDANAPARCEHFVMENIGGQRGDGSLTLKCESGEVHGNFFGQSSFASHALVRERNLVKVSKDLPLETLGPLGCGVITGAGTVLNFLKPIAGSSIAIFGAGAVGLSAVMAAKVAHCGTIVLIDLVPERLSLGQELGATHVIDARHADIPKAIIEITGKGAHSIIESSGAAAAMTAALQSLAPGGTLVPVGVSAPGTILSVPIDTLKTGRIQSVIEGDSVPQTFIPHLIDLHREGRFPFTRLLSYFGFEQINEAMHASETGGAIKPVLLMPKAAAARAAA